MERLKVETRNDTVTYIEMSVTDAMEFAQKLIEHARLAQLRRSSWTNTSERFCLVGTNLSNANVRQIRIEISEEGEG